MPIIRSSRLYLCYSSFPHPGRIACCPAPDRRPPSTKGLHTICGNNTSIVSTSWWWAYKWPKLVEQIISAINHLVASSWFSSLLIYNDARANAHQIWSWCLLAPNSLSTLWMQLQSERSYDFMLLSFSIITQFPRYVLIWWLPESKMYIKVHPRMT